MASLAVTGNSAINMTSPTVNCDRDQDQSYKHDISYCDRDQSYKHDISYRDLEQRYISYRHRMVQKRAKTHGGVPATPTKTSQGRLKKT